MNFNKKIKELEAQIKELKTQQHNEGMKGVAYNLSKDRDKLATVPELKFKEIAEKKGLKLKYQYRIDIYKKTKFLRFYFADFCDVKNKLIFEVDGGYHQTDEQRKKDYKRTLDLHKKGYKVFRITNEEVMLGGTTSFLYKCYKSIGINLYQ